MWLREVMSRIHATGFIVMLDSSRPQHFGEFLSVVYTIRGFHENAPLVVAANKQDSRYAWSPQDIQLGLGIRDVSVLPCRADDRDQVREIVLDLLYQVMS
jgi:signal recognition particle receptor subunit beta